MLVPLLILALASSPSNEDSEPELQRESKMFRNQSDRPLTLPEDLFAVYGSAGGGQLTSNIAYLALGAGAEYGVTDDLQVEISLLRISLSSDPSSGLRDPIGAVTYRLTSGIFELGGHAGLSIPIGTKTTTLFASTPMMLRIAPFARIDFTPEVSAAAEGGWKFSAAGTGMLRVQIGNSVSVGAMAVALVPDFRHRDFSARFGGRLTYTFGKANRGDFDLSLSVLAPATAFAGQLPVEPSEDRYFSAVVELRAFIPDTTESPFKEEL